MGNQSVTRGGETMGLEIKPKLSVILAAVQGTSIALSYIVTKAI